METWFENIRNPTVHTLMNNFDNHFWIDYLHNLTNNISRVGLVKDIIMLHDFVNPSYEESDDNRKTNPYLYFVRHLIWDFDEEKLALYTPHLSKKLATKVVMTITMVLWYMINMCAMLTNKMRCNHHYKCYQAFNTLYQYPKDLDLHKIYKVPKQDSDSNYWRYFKIALTRNMCMINNTSEVDKCKIEKSHQNRILSDNTIWDSFIDNVFFDEMFERDKKRSASKLAYSLCRNCLSTCKGDYNRIVRFRDIMYEVLCLLSQGISAFLLISACAVYSMTPKLRRNINGKSTICHLVTLTFTAFFLFIDGIMDFTENSIIAAENNTTNKITGLVIWYSTLSAFFWLNSICLDTFIAIWKGGRFIIKGSSRLKMYMVFSWGLPLVITLIIFIMTSIEPKLQRRYFYTRVFSSWKEGGWTRGGVLIRWLWDTPMIISLLLNLLIFAATAWVLYQHSRQIKILEGGNSGCSNRANLSRASIYLRLFSLVGIHWVVQMYGWRLHLLFPYIQIIGNFQGSITFLILICRKSTIKAFKTRHDKPNPGKLIK